MISPIVLKNKGVPVPVAEVSTGTDGRPSRVFSEDQLVTTERFVQFTNNTLIDLEEKFGTLEDFQKAIEAKPRSAVRAALAIAWEIDEKLAGHMMIEDKLDSYATGIGVALAVANGVDPTKAVEMLEVGISATREMAKVRESEVERMLVEARAEIEQFVSPGSNGSVPGLEPGVPSTSSGD